MTEEERLRKSYYDNLQKRPVAIGTPVKRKPCGRICRVVDTRPGAYKIQDTGFWTGWVSEKTFRKNWLVT